MGYPFLASYVAKSSGLKTHLQYISLKFTKINKCVSGQRMQWLTINQGITDSRSFMFLILPFENIILDTRHPIGSFMIVVSGLQDFSVRVWDQGLTIFYIVW